MKVVEGAAEEVKVEVEVTIATRDCAHGERANGALEQRDARPGPETIPSAKGQTLAADAHFRFDGGVGAGVRHLPHNSRDRNSHRRPLADRAARSRAHVHSFREIPRDENSVRAGSRFARSRPKAEEVGAHCARSRRRSRTKMDGKSQRFRQSSREGETAVEELAGTGSLAGTKGAAVAAEGVAPAADKAEEDEEDLREAAVRDPDRQRQEELRAARHTDLSRSPRVEAARVEAVAQRARERPRAGREHYRPSAELDRVRRQELESAHSRHGLCTVCLSESDREDDFLVPIVVDVA